MCNPVNRGTFCHSPEKGNPGLLLYLLDSCSRPPRRRRQDEAGRNDTKRASTDLLLHRCRGYNPAEARRGTLEHLRALLLEREAVLTGSADVEGHIGL